MSEFAPPGRYEADPSHSSVLFRIKHLGLAWYTGRFVRLAASLDLTEGRLESARVKAKVELRSVRMEYQGTDKDWDKELAEDEGFLWSSRQPVATFVSTAVRRVAEDRLSVEGELSLRGVSRPFIFDTAVNGVLLDHPAGRPMIGFSATGLMKRSEYGLTIHLGPRMPDDVQIVIETEFIKAD